MLLDLRAVDGVVLHAGRLDAPPKMGAQLVACLAQVGRCAGCSLAHAWRGCDCVRQGLEDSHELLMEIEEDEQTGNGE